MMKQFLQLINPKTMAKLMALVTVQQLFVSLGTALTGLAGQNLQNSQVFLVLVMGVLATSVLPQLLKPLIRKTEFQTYWDAYSRYLKLRLFSQQGSPQKWQNQSAKEKFYSAIGPDAESYIAALGISIYDCYLFALTILLNIAALALVVDPLFPVAFLASGIISLLLFKFLSAKVGAAVQVEQEKRNQFFSHILRAWDNVLLNNKSISQRYQSQNDLRSNEARQAIAQSFAKSEGMIAVIALFSSLPVFGLILWLVSQNLGNTPYLSGLLVTIPQQLMILTSFRSFFEHGTYFMTGKARLKALWENSVLQETVLQDRIQLDKIRIDGKAFETLASVVATVSTLEQGRLTIRGSNGAGKSTLLLYLNANLNDSIYLPAHSQLEIGADLGVESTGEKIIKYLEFITEQNSKVLLLDEWDANLDDANSKMISDRIEDLAKSRVVIEVRHRADA